MAALFTTRALVLRRRAYGDFDLIVTLLTWDQGKRAVIAKSAKKSTKRFQGVLEPFGEVTALCRTGRGMPVLQEATLEEPCAEIRGDVLKTAYANYWTEIIDIHLEEGHRQRDLYRLLRFALTRLNGGALSQDLLSLLFQLRFLKIVGLGPDFSNCVGCRQTFDEGTAAALFFDMTQGGFLCPRCKAGTSGRIRVSGTTIKQIAWMDQHPVSAAVRIRPTIQAFTEGAALLEAFVAYHLGKTPRSLAFLRGVRAPA